MNQDRYNMSFTSGGLFCRESVKLAELYLTIGDWSIVREKTLSENLLQVRTISSSKRLCREIISRLKKLSQAELFFLVNATMQDQGYLIWIAVCRRYRFVADFAIEVLRERYINLKTDLHHEDFDSFFNRKSEWHPELEELQPATRKKLRQVLFRILRESGLLTTRNVINAAMPSAGFLEIIYNQNREEALFIPLLESDLKGVSH